MRRQIVLNFIFFCIFILVAGFFILFLVLMIICRGFGLETACTYPLINKTQEEELFIVGAFQTLLLMIGFIIAYLQYRQTLKSEKKRYTYNVTTIVSQESFYRTIEELRIKFYVDLRNPNITYADVTSKLQNEERQRFEILLERLLSLYEGIALNINQDLIDEDYAFEFLCHTVPRTYFWAEPYINKLRDRTKDPKIFEHLEQVAKRWRCRLMKEQRKGNEQDGA